jgi:hypothetical protein
MRSSGAFSPPRHLLKTVGASLGFQKFLGGVKRVAG